MKISKVMMRKHMTKKYLLLTLIASQTVLLQAGSDHALKEELFEKIAQRNEMLKQFGRQVTTDPFEENIVASTRSGDSVTEKIKIFVAQQNKDLTNDKQPQYLLESEEKIQDLKKKLLFEQQTTNTSICLWQLVFTAGIVKSIHTDITEKKHAPSHYILYGIFGLITAGLQFLTTDTQPAIDSYANSIYTIRTLKLEIQQQQKNNPATSVNDETPRNKIGIRR